MKNKVCFLTSVHPVFDTRIFHKEARTLVEAGYDVVLIAQHDKAEHVEGVRIMPLPKPRNRFSRMLGLTLKAFWLGLKENADIYHFHDPELMIAGVLLRALGKTVVYDMHENVPKQIFNKNWICPWIRKPLASIFSFMERIFLVNIPVIFAESSYAKDYSWVKRSEVVLNMPRLEAFKRIAGQKKHASSMNVGYLGGVSDIRGSFLMIEALGILKGRGFDSQFHCVGPMTEQHRKELELRSARLDLRGIHFYGQLNAPEGYQIISKTNVGLAILKPIGNYLESYPTKMFEYMSLGIPVVASNFPLWREVVDGSKCGLCVDPLNPQATADAIQWLFEHPQDAEEMGRNGQHAVLEKYNWDKEARELLNFYEKLIT